MLVEFLGRDIRSLIHQVDQLLDFFYIPDFELEIHKSAQLMLKNNSSNQTQPYRGGARVVQAGMVALPIRQVQQEVRVGRGGGTTRQR